MNRLLCSDCYEKEILGIYHSSSDEKREEEYYENEKNEKCDEIYCEECNVPISDKKVTICINCLETKRMKLLEGHLADTDNGKDKIMKVGCPDCNKTFKVPIELDYSKKGKLFVFPYCPKCSN